jgi:hypothetical protein
MPRKLSRLHLNHRNGGSNGERCPEEDLSDCPKDPLWDGWKGQTAHPRSPIGGGGPGNFHGAQPLSGGQHGGETVAHPSSPSAMNDPPEPLAKPRKNSPPVTVPREKELQAVSNSFVKIDLKAEIVADGSVDDANVHGKTKLDSPEYSTPGYNSSGGKISAIDGKLTVEGTVRIQTVYGPEANADDYSCYGRGTTDSDVLNGDVTLGFHESRHQEDYWDNLDNNTLPVPPTLTIGMTVADFKAALKTYTDAYTKYWTDIDSASHAATDEVGHKKSTVASTGKCYPHKAP